MTSHRHFCNSKELENNLKINTDIKPIFSELRCFICNQICELQLDKEKLTFSSKCINCDSNANKSKVDAIKYYYKLRNKINNNNEYLKKSDFYCQKHHQFLFNSFCKTCNLNFCERCLNRHSNHEIIDLNSITPKQNEVFCAKIKVRKIKEKYEKIIKNFLRIKDKIENEINSLITKIKDICKLDEYIIKNYNVNNPNKNFYYLQNFKTIINNLDINFPLMEEFYKKSNFETRSKALIEIINKTKSEDLDVEEEEEKDNDKNTNSNNSFSLNNNKKRKITKNNFKEHNVELIIGKMNISLNDTFQKNERLEEKQFIQKEFNKQIKIPVDEKFMHLSNKDNNGIRKSLMGKNINNINSFLLLKESDPNNLNNNFNINSNINSNIINKSENNEQEIEIEEKDDNKKKLELKEKMKFENIIKSIEFLNEKEILICDSISLKIYEINNSYNLNLIYKIEIGENKMNYGTVLKNGNIIICSICEIFIIKLEKNESKIINHKLIQKIQTKGYNINKIIEIPNKSSFFSCDKNYIIKYKKNSNSQYEKVNMVKIDSEIKCIEYINDDIFVGVMPDINSIVFYDIDSIHNNFCLIEKIFVVHGRYVISNVNKFNCIFFAGTIGIYIFSNINYNLISLYKLDEWISAIYFDFERNYLICGGINKNDINNKNVRLTIFSIENNDKEKEDKDKINLIIKEKIDNICDEEITSINCSKENLFIGSKDKTLQLYNY